MADSHRRFDAHGEIREWIGSAGDITKRKTAAQDLLDSNKRKDEFLAMLAHELRNPLAPISTAAEILKIVPHHDAKISRASEIIGRQVRHLIALVDDLLDVSRVTRGLVNLNKESVDLLAILDSAVEQAKPLLDARHHAYVIRAKAGDFLVVGDRNRLVQVIVNLLNNAAKYTPERGNILLSAEREEDVVIIAVEDNGIGIDAALLPHIFDLFTQAERMSDRSHGGLGIGLAFARTIIAMHGGSLAVQSAGRGAGSRFTITLPSADATRERSAPDFLSAAAHPVMETPVER